MGYTRRKLCQRKMLLAKQMKKPINMVIKIMPMGFTDEQFVSEFQVCYRYLWHDLQKEQNYYWNKNKKFRGKKPLLFPSPYRFVLSTAFHVIKRARKSNWHYMTDDDRTELRQNLVIECNKKIEQRNKKHSINIERLQRISPGYADSMIHCYFYQWHYHPENANLRFYILNEIAKFNSKKHVGFMLSAMARDTNDACRELAHNTLQMWGETAVLRKKHGKHPGDNIKPAIPDNPTALMDLIENMQMECDKSYNVFISHRSTEASLVVSIKNSLNKLGYSVYVDWMIDKDGLEPSKYNEKTWPILKHRMRHCDNVLYVHTASCADSKWIPRELKCAEELSIPLFVLNVDGTQELKECDKYSHISFEQLNTIQKNKDR